MQSKLKLMRPKKSKERNKKQSIKQKESLKNVK